MPRFGLRRMRATRRFRRSLGRRSIARNRVSHRARVGYKLPGAQTVSRAFQRMNLGPFKETMWATLKFTDLELALASGIGGVVGVETVYRLNSAFDPQLAVTANLNAEYFSTFAALYFRYIVDWVEVEVQFYDPSANTAIPYVLLQPSDAGDIVQGQTFEYCELRRNMQPAPLTSVTGYGSQSSWKTRINLWELEGLTRDQWMTNYFNFGALVTTNPSFNPLIRIGLADRDGQNATTCKCMVNIVMHTKFFARKTAPA